eukprot:CAMPEP_0202464658 /NCGR_PEP_ID=MMETSP1360-20130828/62633_1 /ASSEMBLY_ACC=CAM_ASM_000848 /TAXON_ID=515479 /ORGANISM="Licmophora paradoxa, Strain CCMP2313" /LENGTH=47 /DNA_ID= /DNA_START= /DNA_END= /DNA_ORIENTATION=
MNGLTMTGTSMGRAVAPFITGLVSSYAYSPQGPGGGYFGSILVYGFI